MPSPLTSPPPPSPPPVMLESFDSVIASSGRLRILTALAVQARMEFVQLRRHTRLTDGNLCTHARRLESAGFVAIEKEFRDRKPVTHMRLTPQGREALERHARELLEALAAAHHERPHDSSAAPRVPPSANHPAPLPEDDWID